MKNSHLIFLVLAACIFCSTGMTSCSKSLEQKVEELREAQKPDDDPIIFTAINRGQTDLVEFMIKSGRFDLNAKNHLGSSPLHAAAEGGKTEIVKLLLRGGANSRSADSNGRLVIHAVAAAGNVEAMKLLINHGENINEPTVSPKLTPMDLEARRLFPGENWGSDDVFSQPIHIAAEKGNIEMVNFLISHGVSRDTPNNRGRTALDYAGKDGLKEQGGAKCGNRLAVVRLFIPNQTETPPKPPEPPVTAEDLQKKYFGR